MKNIRINWSIVTPSLLTGAAGMALGAFLLIQMFGFMSISKAEQLAAETSNKAVVAVLAPRCAVDFRSLPDAKERMVTLVANKNSYQAKDSFPSELITRPGTSYVDYNLLKACTALLTQPKTAGL